ncbi:ATP-binding protein [Kitasatospora sp. NPDC057015]|uniref:ATP-binding protein n=1 Tax=Kitasatospora sp. NPDC057015 TaxID=3346001 RepID=UPI0036270CBF
MTQIALLALAALTAAALVATGILARARRRVTVRAEGAEERLARCEDRAREAEARLARSEEHTRTAEGRLAQSEQRTRTAEDRLARSEERLRSAEEAGRALLAEIAHLAEERLPATALRLTHPMAPVPGPKAPGVTGDQAERALQAVLDAVAVAVTGERDRVDGAARATMRGATSKIQTLLYQIQSLVQQLQHDHDDPRLLELDFRNEVALRRIQTVAVLCEAWPGLARTDSPLAEVVLGALSRVPGYARIKVANHLREERLAVVARAAEPLAVAIAELLANATAYSHPETEVPVTVQQGGRGALVVIDDSGIGMEEDQLRRAKRLLTGPPEVLLTELGNPPKAGFAVVGKLARQYGFACHIEPSPYGGMRTIVRIPGALLTVVDAGQQLSVLTPLPVAAPLPAAVPLPVGRDAEPSAAPDPDPVPAVVPTSDPAPVVEPAPPSVTPLSVTPLSVTPPSVTPPSATPAPAGFADPAALPSRRRRAPLPPQTPSTDHRAEAPATSGRTPEQASARWQALQDGTGSGRAAVASSAPSPTSENPQGADQ